MSERDINIFEIEQIADDDLLLIEREVIRDVEPIKEEDPETAEILEIYTHFRISMYNFLKWSDNKFRPSRILYPASGHDVIPKLVFGEQRVVHTSVEEYYGDQNYFTNLGEGKKVIALNQKLPFKKSSFDIIVIAGLPENVPEQLTEFSRALSVNGHIIFGRQTHELVHTDESNKDQEILDYLKNSPTFEESKVPEELQFRGDSQTEFWAFKKISYH
jgi:hypothetical protein